jgi:hypothetical protein
MLKDLQTTASMARRRRARTFTLAACVPPRRSTLEIRRPTVKGNWKSFD